MWEFPAGMVPFMSETWQQNFRHAILECERLGLEFTTITGPGWTGTGGPWVKYYSGIAVYRKTFNLAQVPGGIMFLEFGVVHEIARVRLNGKDLGVVGAPRGGSTSQTPGKEGRNDLEIEVANLWPNRLIGDAARPADQHFTWTIAGHSYTTDSKILRSGLLGPVRILISEK